MPIWILSLPALPSRHEKPSKNIWPPFLRKPKLHQNTLQTARMMERFPRLRQRPASRCPLFCPQFSLRPSERNLPQTMRLDTTGSQRKADNNGKFMASLGVQLTRRDEHDRS